MAGDSTGLLTIGRCCVSAGISLVALSSDDLLLKINNVRASSPPPLSLSSLLTWPCFLLSHRAHVSCTLSSHSYQSYQGDAGKTGKILALIEMASSLASFFWNPIASSMMDAWGRKILLVLCPLLSAVARSSVAASPSVATYVGYRVLNTVALEPLFPVVNAVLADIFGRGTSKCLVEQSKLNRALTVTRLLVLLGSQMVGHAGTTEQRFFVASGLNIIGALIMLLGVKETLPEESRAKLTLGRAVNPFSFLSFFGWTGAPQTASGKPAQPRSALDRSSLRAIGTMLALQSLTCCNSTVGLYRMNRYGASWGLSARAQMTLVSEFMGLIESYAQVAICENWLKFATSEARSAGETNEHAALIRVARWSQRIKAFTNVHSAYTPDYRSLYGNLVLDATRQGPVMIERIVVAESKRVREKDPNAAPIGQGELHAALSSLEFPIRLLAPWIFSQSYGASLDDNWFSAMFPRGAGAFLLCAALQGVNSELMLPYVAAALRNAHKQTSKAQ